jgi:hypothetical protein
MKIDFEQFLMDKHVEEINCTDRNVGDAELHDAFQLWVAMLPTENLISLSDEYTEQVIKRELGIYAMTMASVQ